MDVTKEVTVRATIRGGFTRAISVKISGDHVQLNLCGKVVDLTLAEAIDLADVLQTAAHQYKKATAENNQ